MIPREAVHIDGVYFKDSKGRVLTLRGLNVGGNSKQPLNPHIPSHVREGFLDADHVSFVGRPFPLESADQHLARIKGYGFNVIRFLITWEAIEHAGPLIYDDEYVDYVVAVLRKCRDHRLLVFIDPHQDVWSRFSGGSGAPLWTLYACGFDPANFTVTEAALTHNFSESPENYPKMVWSTNYHRLVSYTMFTLFFAGREFAPKAVINGENIQSYLEDRYLSAIRYLAQRIHDAGDLEDTTVIGWETMNEPSTGLLGYTDLNTVMATQQLRRTTCPTAFQCMLLGEGIATNVDVYDWTQLGPKKMGTRLVDPQGAKAWLSSDYYDKKYGWNRDPEWKLGQCIWAQHGVWDLQSRKLLRPDYFLFNRDGEKINNDIWLKNYFMVHFKWYSGMVRSIHKNAILFLQPPVMFIPPVLESERRDKRLVFAPHYYDGLTLMLKKWSKASEILIDIRNWWNIDALGYVRGKYKNPLFALRVGYVAVRNSLRDQLVVTKQEGLDNMGDTPCLMSEIGIPYDMDNKKAYNDGKFTGQYAAMDANNYALEGAGLSYTLWNYCPDNNHFWGDFWNGEDLSVWSYSDAHCNSSTGSSPVSPKSTVPTLVEPNDARQEPTSRVCSSPTEDTVGNMNALMKKNYSQSSIEMSSVTFSFPYNPSLNAGSRAFEAFVRPSPILIAGTPKSYGFDIQRCRFSLCMVPYTHEPPEDAPTEIFVPEYLFQDCEPEIWVSSGRWIMYRPGQVLRWWHAGSGEQTIKISSGYKREGFVGTMDDDVEGWYYWNGKCQIM